MLGCAESPLAVVAKRDVSCGLMKRQPRSAGWAASVDPFAGNRSQDCLCQDHEVGGIELELESTVTTAHEDRRPVRSTLVDNSRKTALLTKGADAADNISRGSFGRSWFRHRHFLHTEGVRHHLQVELCVHRYHAYCKSFDKCDNEGLEHSSRLGSKCLRRFWAIGHAGIVRVLVKPVRRGGPGESL